VSGYLRPRLTDEQAGLLEVLIQRELHRDGIRTLEAAMLGRAQRAFDDAHDKREERRRVRAQRVQAREGRLGRRGFLAAVLARPRRRRF
jgi:hypothetical protein